MSKRFFYEMKREWWIHTSTTCTSKRKKNILKTATGYPVVQLHWTTEWQKLNGKTKADKRSIKTCMDENRAKDLNWWGTLTSPMFSRTRPDMEPLHHAVMTGIGLWKLGMHWFSFPCDTVQALGFGHDLFWFTIWFVDYKTITKTKNSEKSYFLLISRSK